MKYDGTVTNKSKDAARLAILRFLSTPDCQTHGGSAQMIAHELATRGPPADGLGSHSRGKLLGEMVEAGLLETGDSHPNHGNLRKAYRITQKGRDFLSQGVALAHSNDSTTPEWTTKITSPTFQQAATDYLALLPEFRHARSDRIQEVSQSLTEIMIQIYSRNR